MGQIVDGLLVIPTREAPAGRVQLGTAAKLDPRSESGEIHGSSLPELQRWMSINPAGQNGLDPA
jgi:hypothetical protein